MAKLIISQVTSQNNDFGLYSQRFCMAFCSLPIGGKIYQLHPLLTCKDYMHEIVRDVVNDRNYSTPSHAFPLTRENKDKLDTTHVRLVVTSHFVEDSVEIFKMGLYSGKRVLNYYEKLFNFSGTTRIFEVELDYSSNKAWLLVGPQEWISNPPILSLYIALVRAFSTMKHKINTIHSNDQILEFIKKYKHLCRDAAYLSQHYDKIKLVLENRQALFPEKPLKESYPIRHLVHHNGGFYNLCNGGDTYCTGTTNTMKEILKKYELEKKNLAG